MPRDVPNHVPPMLAVALPSHALDQRRQEHCLHDRTCASRHRDDDDDDYADICQFGDDDNQHHSHSHSSAGNLSW